MTARFQDLCDGYCGIAGVPAPQLEMEAEGLVAFHVRLRGVTVDFVYSPAVDDQRILVIVEMGPLPEHNGAAVAGLLDANFFRQQPGAPVFARNPATGDAVLQLLHPLEATTAADLFAVVDAGIDTALQWRDGEVPSASSTPPASLIHGLA
ncbi:CesT family type III secretion system chaperone [Ramlibacter sp.]|uniref:CesT family type III secretion system chaperone n=1 Tax=Ramlibacter sp. TaxID=1917967 RepID=UPI003D0FB539